MNTLHIEAGHAINMNTKGEYITHMITAEGEFTLGHYFNTLAEALEDFHNRTGIAPTALNCTSEPAQAEEAPAPAPAPKVSVVNVRTLLKAIAKPADMTVEVITFSEDSDHFLSVEVTTLHERHTACEIEFPSIESAEREAKALVKKLQRTHKAKHTASNV